MYLQGDFPVEKEQGAPARASRRRFQHSFLLHIRPRTFNSEAIRFSNTWFLGFLSVFFLVLECVTGLILMVYYTPTPADAYESIVRLRTEVPFGSVIRDLHRIGGELMIVVVVLHLVRVFVADAYRGRRAFTWITGVLLLLCTLVLAFSGYLLPWDQLAYWAVTIGTSIADTIPGIGPDITLLLRGGAQFGADGLLRFYLLHVLGIPFLMLVFLGIHYYRVSRLHGLSRPFPHAARKTAKVQPDSRSSLFPTVLMTELVLSLFLLSMLLVFVALVYDAPLESHADPRHTPAQTRAPWFFLWLQGVLKFGDSFMLGICLPLAIIVLLLLLPYFGKGERKRLRKRPWALIGLIVLGGFLVTGSMLGLPEYGVHVHPVSAVLQETAPEESPGRFHQVGYDQLPAGLYGNKMEQQKAKDAAGFNEQLQILYDELDSIAEAGSIVDPQTVVIVEEWQAELKRLTIRVTWRDADGTDNAQSAEQIIFIHKDRAGGRAGA